MKNLKKQRNIFKTQSLDYLRKEFPEKDESAFKKEILEFWNRSDGWVLGHAMNGLLWGKVQSDKFILAYEADPDWGAPLKASTLLDIRIFNPDKELRLWRANSKLKGCLVYESADKAECRVYDEKQIFLANKRLGECREICGVKFSLMEGLAGQRQAIPVDWDGKNQAYRLCVRHYLSPRPENGMLRVAESRLLKLAKVRQNRGK